MIRLLLPLTLLSAGCTSGEQLLGVHFDRVELGDLDWEHADTEFIFQVDNKTPLGFSIDRFDYSLAFAGVDWLSGEDLEGLTVLGDGSSEVSLPVDVIFSDVYELVQATRGSDTIDFDLDGSLGIALETATIDPEGEASTAGIEQSESGACVIDFPYSVGGDFPALRTPKVSFSKLRVASLSLTEADLEIELGVDNEHASSLWFTYFDYELGLGGTAVASGFIDELGEIPGAGARSSRTLTLPVTIDLWKLGGAAYELFLDGGEIEIDLSAAADVDTPFGVIALAIDEAGDVSIEPAD